MTEIQCNSFPILSYNIVQSCLKIIVKIFKKKKTKDVFVIKMFLRKQSKNIAKKM